MQPGWRVTWYNYLLQLVIHVPSKSHKITVSKCHCSLCKQVNSETNSHILRAGYPFGPSTLIKFVSNCLERSPVYLSLEISTTQWLLSRKFQRRQVGFSRGPLSLPAPQRSEWQPLNVGPPWPLPQAHYNVFVLRTIKGSYLYSLEIK